MSISLTSIDTILSTSKRFHSQQCLTYYLLTVSLYCHAENIENHHLSSNISWENWCYTTQSEYEVKKKIAFESKAEWRFPFWNISSFSLQRYLRFLHYANEESDDVIGGFAKTVQHSIKNISRNIKAVFFKLSTRNVHHKRKKMTPVVSLPWQQLCHWPCFN